MKLSQFSKVCCHQNPEALTTGIEHQSTRHNTMGTNASGSINLQQFMLVLNFRIHPFSPFIRELATHTQIHTQQEYLLLRTPKYSNLKAGPET